MNTRFTKNCLALTILFLLLLPTAKGYAAETTIVSVDPADLPGNGDSQILYSSPSISADGRFVAFASLASNLVAGDTNGGLDVFVHDRTTGTTTLVDVDSAGLKGNGYPALPSISADSRFVAFTSTSSNLVAGDTNRREDVFVHDLTTGATSRVSVDSSGKQGNDVSQYSSISADGRFVVFTSIASNLVADDTNGSGDIFVHDRTTGITTRISVDSAGLQGNAPSYYTPAISADGRFIVFASVASNLVAGDTNGQDDIFFHDRNTGKTTRLSVDSTGQEGNNVSTKPVISADGRFIAFISLASNLVASDTNGQPDVFVHDRITGATTRVSVNSAGLQANNGGNDPVISADGRFVAFWSDESTLVENDTNGTSDIFVHDQTLGTTTRVSVSSTKRQGNGQSYLCAINADGRFVAFNSAATNLTAEGNSLQWDTFVHDRQLNTTKTADLQLAVTSQPISVQTGQTAGYTYTLTNNGPDSINTEVKLTDVIVNGRVLSLTPSQGSCKKAAVSVCRFGALATGASVTLTAEIKAGSEPLTQQLSVNAPPVDNVPDNNSVTVSTPVTP